MTTTMTTMRKAERDNLVTFLNSKHNKAGLNIEPGFSISRHYRKTNQDILLMADDITKLPGIKTYRTHGPTVVAKIKEVYDITAFSVLYETEYQYIGYILFTDPGDKLLVQLACC